MLPRPRLTARHGRRLLPQHINSIRPSTPLHNRTLPSPTLLLSNGRPRDGRPANALQLVRRTGANRRSTITTLLKIISPPVPANIICYLQSSHTSRHAAMLYATPLSRSSSPFATIYSASAPPLPILQQQVPESIVVSDQLNRRHRSPTHPTHSEQHAGPFVESCEGRRRSWGASIHATASISGEVQKMCTNLLGGSTKIQPVAPTGRFCPSTP